MGDGKVRCTTCYNVFNTAKEEGQNVICPMCDASFTVKKINLVSNITQSITDFTSKIGSNIKETLISGNKDEDIFKIIDGKKYDNELLKVATELTEKIEEITIEGSKQLFNKISDYDDYTQIEKQTVAYIRKNYKFTPEANKWLRKEIRKWTATKTRGENVSDPTSSKFKKRSQMSFVFTNLKDAYRWDNISNLNEKPKTPAQWAGILLSIVFVLGILSGIAYGIKWNNQDSQWNNEGLSSVHGTIIDTNGDAIEGAKVEANNKKAYSNPQGKYYLYDLVGDEIQITFSMEGYGDVIIWINIRSEGTNILNIELLEGNIQNYDYRKNIAEPWPPNYALAPIFMISAMITLMGSSAALLQQNFKTAIAGCLFGIISYGFLIGSILSVIALSLLLVDRESFERKR
jgi:hypothetical protein